VFGRVEIERQDDVARVVGLSERETELLLHLVGGSDTHALARRLFLSEHTVQDHLKSVFAKTGTNNRRVLVARATGSAALDLSVDAIDPCTAS
jgi:DNA-binding CsgD family transcriptional regulator